VLHNAAIFTVLAYAGIGLGLSGIGLWPTVLVHATMTVWCATTLLRSHPWRHLGTVKPPEGDLTTADKLTETREGTQFLNGLVSSSRMCPQVNSRTASFFQESQGRTPRRNGHQTDVRWIRAVWCCCSIPDSLDPAPSI